MKIFNVEWHKRYEKGWSMKSIVKANNKTEVVDMYRTMDRVIDYIEERQYR